MIAAVSRWLVRVVVAVALITAISGLFLFSTTAGTRFVLARLEPFLPAALSLHDVTGSVSRG